MPFGVGFFANVGGIEITGGTITVSGGYTYHTFTASDSFSLKGATLASAEVLLIGGGGGGGSTRNPSQYGAGGGGGAAEVKYQSLSIAPGVYSMVIGAGGGSPADGSDSTAFGYTALRGMRGNGSTTGTDLSGACGGGQGFGDGADRGPTVGTIRNGGSGVYDSRGGGGGGMAENGSVDGTGLGGDGINTYSTWATATSTGVSGFYAGGGGGGNNASATTYAGGDGGGGTGAGASTTSPTGGATNTGSGGGGSSSYNQFGFGAGGGSGLVIVRYPTL